MERGRAGDDRAEHDVVGGNERAQVRAELDPAAHQGEELLRRERQLGQALEQRAKLGDVSPLRRGEVGASLRAAVCCHHREGDLGHLAERGRRRLLDPRAELRERRRRAADGVLGAGGRAPDAVVDVEAGLQLGDVDRARVVLGSRRGERILAVGSGDQRQKERQIVNVATHRPDAAHVEHACVARRRPDARLRDEPRRRSDAEDAAVVAGDADRAEPVGADPGGGGIRREQGRLAATRAATGARGIVRIRRPPADDALGLVRPGVLGHSALGKHDGADLAQPTDNGRVARRNVPGARERAARAGEAGDGDRVLDRHGQPEQRQRSTRRPRPIGVRRRGPGRLGVERRDRVQPRANPLEPSEVVIGELSRGQLARPEPAEPLPRGGLAHRLAGV